MVRDDTQEKAKEIIESFENCHLWDEILLLTPRDIKEAVIDRQNEHTDNQKMEELVTRWLEKHKEENTPETGREPTDAHLTQYERHELLLVTKKSAERWLDFLTIDNPKVSQSKCSIEEYREDMEYILEMALPTSDTKEKKLLKFLKEMGYNIIRKGDGYVYYGFFLYELMSYELFLCREIAPYKKELASLKRYKRKPNDKIWEKRLEYYQTIGERNKHKHLVTFNSNKWAIPFDKFAKLYRKILDLSNKAIGTPLK